MTTLADTIQVETTDLDKIKEQIAADVEVDPILLDIVKGKSLDFNITQSVLDARVKETMEGAPTFTVMVHDPDLNLLRSDVLFEEDDDGKRDVRPINVEVDQIPFRLVQVRWDDATAGRGVDLTLTFEHLVVAALRQHSRRRKVSRARSTLAEFIQSFAREVKVIRIRFVAPDLKKKQPIEKSKKESDADREPGLADDADIKVKRRKATRKQLQTIEAVLSEGEKMGVSKKLMIVAIMVITQESVAGVKNVSSSGKHHGPFHQDASYGTEKQRRNSRHAAREFFKRAEKLERTRKSITYEALAEGVQKSGQGAEYTKWRDEAEDTVKAFGGGSTTSRTFFRQFNYIRGVDGKKESSWDCSQRYAELVNWRSFVVGRSSWYFISEPRLYKSRARMTISAGHPAVVGVRGEMDRGKPAGTLNVTARIRRWQAPPGSVVVVEGYGPGDGRWLVQDIERSLYSPLAEITLKQPTKPLPEPAPDTQTVTNDEESDGSLRFKIVREAEKTMTVRSGFKRYSQPGRLTTDPTPPAGARTDCSQWIRAIYLKAGAKDPGLNTWEQARKGKRTKKPRPGDLMFTRDGGHVELYIGGGNTIGHGSPPIDKATVGVFPGHFFVTFDFLDDEPKKKKAKTDKPTTTDTPGGIYNKGDGRPD